MDELLVEYAERTGRHPEKIVRMMLACAILKSMMDTPTHGLTGQASKQAKVEAAFDYADLLMKG
jgi:hypothetical protein